MDPAHSADDEDDIPGLMDGNDSDSDDDRRPTRISRSRAALNRLFGDPLAKTLLQERRTVRGQCCGSNRGRTA
jgi:hypothetical protein